MVGLALKNEGKGRFIPLSLDESHFFVPGDGKSLVQLPLSDQKSLIVASQNNDSLKVFKPLKAQLGRIIPLRPEEVKVRISFGNDQIQNNEFYWGSTFQSQSSRSITVPTKAKKVQFFNNFGKETRNIKISSDSTAASR